MSEWKREDDLDEPLSPAHRLLDQRMAAIERDLIQHTHPQIDKIIEILDGPMVEDLDGNEHRDTTQGIRYQTEKMSAKIDQLLVQDTQRTTSTIKKVLSGFLGGSATSAAVIWLRAWEWILR